MAAGGQAQNIDALPFAYGKKVQIFLREESITDLQNIDTIVNFVDKDNAYGQNGIIEAAGNKVKQEYDKKCAQRQDGDHYGVITTQAGKLPHNSIFHIPLSDTLPTFKSAIYYTLKQVAECGLKSIAFPAVADHQYVDSYLDVFYGFEKRANPVCLRIIDIITNNDADYQYHDDQMTKLGETL